MRTIPIYFSTNSKLRNLSARATPCISIAIQQAKISHWQPGLVAANSAFTSSPIPSGRGGLALKWVIRTAAQTKEKNTTTYKVSEFNCAHFCEMFPSVIAHNQNNPNDNFDLPLMYSKNGYAGPGTQVVYYLRDTHFLCSRVLSI